jgi:hypothetical protein
VYGFTAKDVRRLHAREEVERFFARRLWAEGAILLVPLLGLAAEAAKPGGGLWRLWVLLAWGLWGVEVVLLALVVWAEEKRLRTALSKSGASGDVALAAARLAWGSVASDVVFFLALVDMVFRPG